jgi:hypothetical protein
MRTLSHSLSSTEDYSYSLPHLIPNIIGNIIGYAGLFVFGQWSLPFYTSLRTSTKQFALPVALIVAVLILAVIYFVRRLKWKQLIASHKEWVFIKLFVLISLLPYLALGNIAERYGYLASVGFVIGVVFVLQQIFSKNILSQKGRIVVGLVLSAFILSWCIVGIEKEQSDWAKASKITYSSLGYFKIEYPNISNNSTFVIVNRPIRYANAWIFPVGMPEGLWFVYGDTTPEVIDSSSILSAKQIAQTKKSSYIFAFDSKNKIQRIK